MQQIQSESSDSQVIRDSLKKILSFIGDDETREGLLDTPDRILKSWKHLFSGYNKNAEDVITTFEDGACDEMVILKNIEFYSTCEHHFLPFFGTVSIGYIPNKKVIGISKLARLAEIYARRLQIQERFTTQIADDLEKFLQPQGVMVVCQARHFCMTARGIEKQKSEMITSAIRGKFKTEQAARQEFLEFIK